MAEYGRVDNPTLDINEFEQGDFVHWLLGDEQPSFAVVRKVIENSISILFFENGFPSECLTTPEYSLVRKASRKESLAHFHKISEGFEKDIAAEGLSGAISARKQHYLNGVLRQMEKDGPGRREAYFSAIIKPQAPKTGIYVLMGIYSGQGPSEHLEGLVTFPRLSERTVSRVMKNLRPNGFGRIPNDVYDTPATSHGDLVAYDAFEIPEKAVGFVKNPKKLILTLE